MDRLDIKSFKNFLDVIVRIRHRRTAKDEVQAFVDLLGLSPELWKPRHVQGAFWLAD